jgi:hypothetical protein
MIFGLSTLSFIGGSLNEASDRFGDYP